MVVLFNYLTRPYLANRQATGNPLVSVLIPARNEEKNIGNLISNLAAQEYSNIEIIIYNDGSTDQTEAIAMQWVATDKRVRLINGVPLPHGWLGKNHACHRLAMEAKGEFFLFLDADVTVAPKLIGNAISYMQRKRLILLSMFPFQIMKTLGEQLVVLNMNWILLSLLPIKLVQWSKKRSLAAANGQFMMFEATSYVENKWHEKVSMSMVEDISISRIIKRKRLRMATLLGSDNISCRMYESYNQALEGFSKNVCAYFGGSTVVASIFTIVVTLSPIIIVFGLPFPLAFAYFFSLVFSRIMVLALSGHPIAKNILFWPIQHYVFILMVYRSVRFYRGGELNWKGRSITAS
jgi:glycosyltransferase involved in cell wall biosynthesis